MDLFLIIYRNNYLKNKIFREIKNYNKSLKYKRYNYYECPLEVIINNKNEIMLLEKVKDYIKYQNDESIDILFKYTFDFNLEIFKKLILWKELDFEILKLMITEIKHIKYYMENQICEQVNNFNKQPNYYLKNNGLNQIYKTLVLGGSNKIKLLDFIVTEFILPKSDQTQVIDWFKILNSKENMLGGNGKFIIEDISLVISKEMYNYLFKNKDDRIRVEIPLISKSGIDSVLYKIVFNGIKNQNNSPSNFKVNKSFFKLLKLDNPSSPETFKEFINQSIEKNDIEMLKYLISRFPYGKDDELNGIECIQLFSNEIQVSPQTLQQFQINIDNFNTDGSELLPLFKILIEKVYKDIGYFTANQRKSIKINGQDYFNYAMHKFDENKILPNNQIINNQNSDKGIICSYECIRNSNSILLYLEYSNIDYYKSEVLNQNLSKFEIYLSKFQFDQDRLQVAISMGFENMVTYVIKDIISKLNHTPYDRLYTKDRDLFIKLYIQSLPNDNVNKNNHYIFELIFPFINYFMLPTDFEYLTTPPYNLIFTKPLPKDPIKRKQFINQTFNRFHKFNEKRLKLVNSLCRSFAKTRFQDLETIFDVPFCDLDKNSPPHIILTIKYYALKNGDFKSMKKLIQNKEQINSFSVYQVTQVLHKLLLSYIDNNRFKLLFNLILNLDKLKIASNIFIKEIIKLCKHNLKLMNLIFGFKNFNNFKIFKWIYDSLKINDPFIKWIASIDDNNDLFIYHDDVSIDRLFITFQLKLADVLKFKTCQNYFNELSNDEKIKLNNHIYNNYFIQQLIIYYPTKINIITYLEISYKVFERHQKFNFLKIFGLTNLFNIKININKFK